MHACLIEAAHGARSQATARLFMQAYGRLERMDQVMSLFRQAGRHGHVPSLMAFNAAIGACSRSGKWEDAMGLRNWMVSVTR